MKFFILIHFSAVLFSYLSADGLLYFAWQLTSGTRVPGKMDFRRKMSDINIRRSYGGFAP